MPVTVLRYDETPNPNALKLVLSGPVLAPGSPPISCRSPADLETCDHPLARALFEVAGVRTVLIHERWLSVNKSPESAWPDVKRGVEAAVTSHAGPGGRSA